MRTFQSTNRPLIVFALAGIIAGACTNPEGDEPCDHPEPAPAALHVSFVGPQGPSELRVGTQNAKTVCFTAMATKALEIRSWQVRLSSQHGFLLDGPVPRFGDIKISENLGPIGVVVAGPVELDAFGSSTSQSWSMNDLLPLAAGETREMCVALDVADDVGLHNEHITVEVLPFEEGDVVLADGSVVSPIDQIDFDTLLAEFVLRAPGSLTYSLAPDDIQSEAGLVVGNANQVVLAKYRFVAERESMALPKLRFRLTDVVSDPSVPHGVRQVTLWDGAVQVGPVAFPTGGGFIDFSGVAFITPEDGVKTLAVRTELNEVGPFGGDSGIDVGVTLCSGDNSAGCRGNGPEGAANGTFEARGLSSGIVDTVGDSGNIQARTKILRKSVPVVVLANLPAATLSNGTQILARFTLTADAAGGIAQKTIMFEPTLHDVGGAPLELSMPRLREVGQAANLPASSSAVACTSFGIGTGACLFPMVMTSELHIPAGQSRTYEFLMTVAGADAAGESVSTRLLGDDARVTGSIGTQGNMIGGTLYNFIWSDLSAVPHNAVTNGSADWTNGRFVRGLPTDGQTLVR